jgi:hypothetical protein
MMTRTAPRRRTGTSLMEVLVGFGILGIGVASVISLYPFAALAAGNALIRDRTTTSALIADGQLRDIHKRGVVEMGEGSNEPYYGRLDAGTGATGLPSVPRDSGEPSYPVFIDPMGFAAGQNGPVGTAGPATGIPRVNLSLVTGSGDPVRHALRFCSQLDGLGYNDDGAVQAGPEMRELRYNWLWVVQRPVNRDRFNLRMQVVVFNQRIHQYRPSMTETVYANVTFTPGQTFIRGVPPNAELRKGSWIMDAGRSPVGAPSALRHAEFYRVVSIADDGTLEVHRPVRSPHGTATGGPATAAPGTPAPYTANLVVMPGVVDVYERPLLNAGYGP